MTDPACATFRESSAELALGVLEGRERADALAHVEHCAACRQELTGLGVVADRLVELTPAAEPPPGFETRVLTRLAGAPARSRVTVGPRAARWAVAAALAVAIGAGGWVIGHHRPAAPAAAGGRDVVTASFVAGSHTVGQVIASGGRYPWVTMALDSNLGDLTVTCELMQRDGRTATIGTFTLANGYGHWGGAIGVAPSSVSGVRLLDSAGTPVATATFGHALPASG